MLSAIAAISSRLQELGWRVLIVWECALRGREKLTDEALSERLEEWICGEGCQRARSTRRGFIYSLDAS